MAFTLLLSKLKPHTQVICTNSQNSSNLPSDVYYPIRVTGRLLPVTRITHCNREKNKLQCSGWLDIFQGTPTETIVKSSQGGILVKTPIKRILLLSRGGILVNTPPWEEGVYCSIPPIAKKGVIHFSQITMEMAQAWLGGIGKISSSSFEVEAIPPRPSASPPDIRDIASTSQDSEDIFQYLLAMLMPLSHCIMKKNKYNLLHKKNSTLINK